MSVLRAQAVGKSYSQSDGQQLTVIGDISLDLIPGEIVCLLGASGSGKTTFLKLLSGLEVPDRGTVQSHIQRPGPTFGYVSQDDRLLPWRTVQENVGLGLELCGQTKSEAMEKAEKVLSRVGMKDFADSYSSQLSGGMQQRVLLARTLVLEPRLLLLDEPMSSLDILARRELAELIKSYTYEQQAATLVVTHSVEEACFLADRVLLVTRSPARLFKEIRITDKPSPHAVLRSEALNFVMKDLWAALGTAI
ncbi:MAG: ABC transporter ATP-binding protein [Alphaproteobacteria bacterium]